MHKLPFMAWDTKLWLSDPAVTVCSPSTRGIWKDLLDVMHEKGRVGQLRGTIDELARLARCKPADFAQALTEIQATKTGDVTERNGIVTVTNRKMLREHKEREASRLRMKRKRARENVTPSVTQKSHAPLKDLKALKAQGLKEKAASAPLTAEPLTGGVGGDGAPEAKSSGLSGSGRSRAALFWGEGWLPSTEADYMQLLTEIDSKMETWGGKWRNRWRENPEKCQRTLAALRDEIKHKQIASAGGYMDDLWKKRMA